MRVLVLGAGGMGGVFGAALIKGGADVTFLVRARRASQLQRDGLVVKSQDGDFQTSVKTIQQGQADAPFDVILLSCKAYDLETAMTAVAPAVGKESAILPLLNGVRHIDVLKDRFGADRVLGGLAMISATLLPDGSVRHNPVRLPVNSAVGELDGRRSPRSEAIQKAFTAGGIAFDAREDIIAAMWEKLFGFSCNAVIATLTRSRAGAIARSEAGASLVSAVLAEGLQIVTAEGYKPGPDTPNVIKGLFSQPASAYCPSMLVDMEEGRPTEGEHTIGDLADRAARRGIAAPLFTAARCNLQVYDINRADKQKTEAA